MQSLEALILIVVAQRVLLITQGDMAHEENPDYFSTTFSIEDEDHTLANALRFFLNKK